MHRENVLRHSEVLSSVVMKINWGSSCHRFSALTSPGVIPKVALQDWIPAFAGMTGNTVERVLDYRQEHRHPGESRDPVSPSAQPRYVRSCPKCASNEAS